MAITLVAFAVAPCARAEDTSAHAEAIKSKLKQMEDVWAKAIMDKDSAAVGKMVADDFAGFSPKAKRRTSPNSSRISKRRRIP